MKKSILCLTMVFASLLLLGSCGEEPVKEEDNTVPVEIAVVQKGSISAENKVSGQVVSGTQESVFVALSAPCTDVYVNVGDYVSAGQAICKVDAASAWSSYDTAVKGYNSAKDTYAAQEAQLSQQVSAAEEALAGLQQQFEAGEIPQSVVDEAKAQVESARAAKDSALSQLESGIQSANAGVTQAKAALYNIDRNGNVVAPISGNVISLNAIKNGFVAPSAPVVTVASASDMQVSAQVSEALVSKLSVGGKATVSIPSSGNTFQASISSLDRSANLQTHLFGVSLKVPAPSVSGLLSGMFADIIFYTDTQTNVVVVPSEAIQTGIDSQYVFTIDANNLAHKIPVETGLVGDGMTEIRSGLVGGEKLVTVGQFYLSDGVEVRVVSAEV
ncbi:MAG: efflux RND transporter periplasmic adaptor subunit [Ruminiclostridium sp.]|nr:efflux RND transporter periplasmic adaptor subunit [Ruminiclostridium sp.]